MFLQNELNRESVTFNCFITIVKTGCYVTTVVSFTDTILSNSLNFQCASLSCVSVKFPYTLSCCMACISLGDLCNRCLVNWSWSPAIAVNECLPTTDESNMCTTPASSASSTSSSAEKMINNS